VIEWPKSKADGSRFLRARQYDFKQSKIMLKNAEDWRAKAGGKGMDELYRELDPFDVRPFLLGPVNLINKYLVSRARRGLPVLAIVLPQGPLRLHSAAHVAHR
jgi:hypothetical protein